MSDKVKSSAVTPALGGEPLDGSAREAAILLLGIALVWRDLEWQVFDSRGRYRRNVNLDEIISDEELYTLQNISAPPESVRGLLAMLASVRPGRRKHARIDKERRDAQRREREAREREGAIATAHLRGEDKP